MALFSWTLPRPLLALLALLALCALKAAADDDNGDASQTTPTPIVTAAPVYLPYYDARSWSLVRGSIVATDPAASRTTYTIFCPTQTPLACDLSLEFPFIIVEGPDTVAFHGTYTSTYIADVECNLAGTTAATCSGYSSYKSGYTNAFHTGPMEISWTSTFSGSQVQWGQLTLTETPTDTDDTPDFTATDLSTPTDPSGMLYEPAPTTSAGWSMCIPGRWSFAGLISAAVAGYVVLL